MDSLMIDALLSDVVGMAPDVGKKIPYKDGNGHYYQLFGELWDPDCECFPVSLDYSFLEVMQVIKEAMIRRGLQFEVVWRPARKIWRVDIVPQDDGTAVRAECGSECEALLKAFKNYLEVNDDRISSKPDSLRNSA